MFALLMIDNSSNLQSSIINYRHCFPVFSNLRVFVIKWFNIRNYIPDYAEKKSILSRRIEIAI